MLYAQLEQRILYKWPTFKPLKTQMFQTHLAFFDI